MFERIPGEEIFQNGSIFNLFFPRKGNGLIVNWIIYFLNFNILQNFTCQIKIGKKFKIDIQIVNSQNYGGFRLYLYDDNIRPLIINSRMHCGRSNSTDVFKYVTVPSSHCEILLNCVLQQGFIQSEHLTFAL